MSSADEPRPDQQPAHEDPTTPVMSHPAGRRRGRLLLPGVFLLAVVVVFLIIILVGHFA
jgi:hypothetical protein